MAEQHNEQSLSEICMSCGLCCDGSLFSRGVVKPGEESEVVEIREKKNGDRFFDIPCKCFEGKCTVYNQRPDTCVKFYCDLILDVKKGKVKKQKALEHIKDMQETIRGFRRVFEDKEAHPKDLRDRFLKELRSNFTNKAFVLEHEEHLKLVRQFQKLRPIFIKKTGFFARWRKRVFE